MWTPDQAAQELLAVLPFLNRLVANELRQETGEDTTMPQFRVLMHLTETPHTLSELARKRRVSLQSAGELVQALIVKGWITRSPDPKDRRQWLLELTDAGREKYIHAQERMTARLTPLMAGLSDKEMEAVQMAFPALRRVLSGEEEMVNSGD